MDGTTHRTTPDQSRGLVPTPWVGPPPDQDIEEDNYDYLRDTYEEEVIEE